MRKTMRKRRENEGEGPASYRKKTMKRRMTMRKTMRKRRENEGEGPARG